MRLGVGQAPASDDLESNVASAVRLVHRAADDRVRLLVLSELFLHGYDLVGSAVRGPAITVGDPRLVPLASVCRDRGVSVFVGAATTDGQGPPHNSLLGFDADGSMRVLYRKVHLWNGERPHFAPGDRGVTVRLDGVVIGIGICYDAGFPEFSRAYAKAGVDAIVFGSAFAFGAERHRFHIYHPARALESGAVVAVSNAVGSLGSTRFHGESAIYASDGSRVVEVTDDEGVVAVDITPGSGAAARASLPYLDDLLPDYRPTLIAEEMK